MNRILRSQIKGDLFRYKGTYSKLSFLHAFWHYPGFRYTLSYRFSKMYKASSLVGLASRVMYKTLETKFGFQIPKSVEIDSGFSIVHFGHLIINSKVRIGKNCTIYPGVTIGATFRGTMSGVPVIGDEVWIGSNAVIVGAIIIGNRVLIAPNTYVNVSVPDDSVVFGNPAIIKHKTNAIEGYITNLYTQV